MLALVALTTCGCAATGSGKSTTPSPSTAAGVDCAAALEAATGSRGADATWDEAAQEVPDRVDAGEDARPLDAVAELEASSGADAPAAASDDAFASSCEIVFDADLP